MIPSNRSIRLETGMSSTNLHNLMGNLYFYARKVQYSLKCVKIDGKKSIVVIKGYVE